MAASAGAGTMAARAASAASSKPQKVLRIAFDTAESGFDPARFGDVYCHTVCAHIFEALYSYDALARPVKLVEVTAAGPAEGSSDFRTWVVRIRPGIFFSDGIQRPAARTDRG